MVVAHLHRRIDTRNRLKGLDAAVGSGGEMRPKQHLTIVATAADGTVTTFAAISRIDTPVEVGYYRNGGILQTVLRQMMKAS